MADPSLKTYSSQQLDQLRADINAVNQDYNNNASANLVKQDVAKFYSDQSSYGLSGYPTIAYSVALNIGMNGITANANMQAGIKSGDSVELKTEQMMVNLAQADMRTIDFNFGAPASIAQITQFHIATYKALNVDPAHWSGYEPALQNGTWIPNATSEDLRDVASQSQYIPDQSFLTQLDALTDLMNAGLVGAQTAMGQYLYNSQGGTPLVSNFSQFLSDLGIGALVGGRSLVASGTYLLKSGGELLVSQSHAGDLTQYTFLQNGKTGSYTVSANGQIASMGSNQGNTPTEYVFKGNQSITSQNANVIVSSPDITSINGSNNRIANILNGSTISVSGQNNTINASDGSTTFISGQNNNFNGWGHSTAAIGANSSAQVNGAGQTVHLLADNAGVTLSQADDTTYVWGTNDSISGNGTKVLMGGNTAEPGQNQSFTANGSNNTINASGNSTTFISGQNNTFNGTSGSVAAIGANSSAQVNGSGQIVHLLADSAGATLSQAGNTTYVWGTNDSISGNGTKVLMGGNTAEPGQNQSFTANGDNNTINASGNSTTFISGQNNTFNGSGLGSIAAFGGNSSGTVNGNSKVLFNGDSTHVTATQAGNNVEVWARNDTLSGASGQNIQQPLGNTGFEDQTTSGTPTTSYAPTDGSSSGLYNPVDPIPTPDPDNQNAAPLGPDGEPVFAAPGQPIVTVYPQGNGTRVTVTNDPDGPIAGQSGGPEITTTTSPGLIGSGIDDNDGSSVYDDIMEGSIWDPIVISYKNDQLQTVSPTTSHHFADGTETGWITPGEGVLVQDEGNQLAPVRDFAALDHLDSNHDGIISAEDQEWSTLSLSMPGDGSRDTSISLDQAGVSSISLTSRPTFITENGNTVTAQSAVSLANGKQGLASDVSFGAVSASAVLTPRAAAPDLSASSLLSQDLTKNLGASLLQDFTRSGFSGNSPASFSDYRELPHRGASSLVFETGHTMQGVTPVTHQPAALFPRS